MIVHLSKAVKLHPKVNLVVYKLKRERKTWFLTEAFTFTAQEEGRRKRLKGKMFALKKIVDSGIEVRQRKKILLQNGAAK